MQAKRVPKRGLEPPRPSCWASDSQSDVATITPLGHYILVGMEGLEPTRLAAADFESAVATITPHPLEFCGGG